MRPHQTQMTPRPTIVEIRLGLWEASLWLGEEQYRYGFFGDKADAAGVLALAMVRLSHEDFYEP